MHLVPPAGARNRTEMFIVQTQCSSLLTFRVNKESNVCIQQCYLCYLDKLRMHHFAVLRFPRCEKASHKSFCCYLASNSIPLPNQQQQGIELFFQVSYISQRSVCLTHEGHVSNHSGNRFLSSLKTLVTSNLTSKPSKQNPV